MATVFQSLKPQGGNKLHAYDLSRRDIFSTKAGLLTPILVQHTIPESKFDITHAQITRVDAIQTASFARMTENYEYYFVPYSQIYHDFERLYYERGEAQRNPNNISFNQQSNISSSVPVFQFSTVCQLLFRYFLRSRILLKFKSQSLAHYDKFLSYLYDDYNLSDLSNEALPFDVHGDICIDDMLRIFDMLGYGNLYPLFQSFVAPLLAFDVPLPSDVDVKTPADSVNSLNVQLAENLMSIFDVVITWAKVGSSDYYSFTITGGHFEDLVEKLFAALRVYYIPSNDDEPYCAWMVSNSACENQLNLIVNAFFDDAHNEGMEYLTDYFSKISSEDRKPSIFALAAYQKVFTDIYRNIQFDTAFYASLFNFDYVDDSDNYVVNINRVLGALIPRYRQYKKDIFTGVYPNAQFGSVAVSGLQSPMTFKAETFDSDSAGYIRVDASTNPGLLYAQGTKSGASVIQSKFISDSGVSALAIRQALSLQRYKERILRAGNRLTALQNAVFGDRSRFLEDQYVQFIGAESNSIDFNSVAATSDAGQSEVGQLAQNGVGTHFGKVTQFHSHDFGIIIGIYYVLPEAEYEAYMIDPMNTKSETNDFYKPDFMNLGLSPVWNYNFNFIGTYAGVNDTVLGYLANYWEYKTSLDKVHGNFYCNLPQPIHYNNNLYPNVTGFEAFTRGQNANFVTPRSASSFRENLTLANLYVNPHDVDSIFYVNSDFTLDTDQFKVNCNHDIKALLPMSVVGLPEY